MGMIDQSFEKESVGLAMGDCLFSEGSDCWYKLQLFVCLRWAGLCVDIVLAAALRVLRPMLLLWRAETHKPAALERQPDLRGTLAECDWGAERSCGAFWVTSDASWVLCDACWVLCHAFWVSAVF